MTPGLFDKFKFNARTEQNTSAPQQSAATPVRTSPFAAASTLSAGGVSGQGKTMEMNDEMFEKYRSFIYEQSGIYFTDNKKYLLEGRVAKRIEALNLKSFNDYYTYISSGFNGRKELPALFDAITINETYFFRNEPQFEALENMISLEILNQKRTLGTKRFRVWSAASSSGEEAYTVAMIILEKLRPKYPDFQFEIIATDINTAVVEKARQGVYRDYAIRNMPKNYLTKYFTQEGDQYIIKPEVKSLVRFSNMNLYDTVAMKNMNSFDVIFCCNVLIYFDQKSKQQVVAHLYDALNKGGYLFIGYSESLHGISKAFRLVHFPKTIAYKKE